MKQDKQIVEQLIAGSVIGAALGALLSKEKSEGSMLGAIAGAAIVATFRANEEARKTDLPILQVEEGSLYEVRPNGNKRFLKKIGQPQVEMPRKFKLR